MTHIIEYFLCTSTFLSFVYVVYLIFTQLHVVEYCYYSDFIYDRREIELRFFCLMSVVTQQQVLFLCKPRAWERFYSNLYSQGVLLTPKPVCDRESGQRASAPVWSKEGLSYRWKLRCSFHRGRRGSVVVGQVLGNTLGMNPAEQPALRVPDREREEWLMKLRPLLPTKHWDGPVQWANRRAWN